MIKRHRNRIEINQINSKHHFLLFLFTTLNAFLLDNFDHSIPYISYLAYHGRTGQLCVRTSPAGEGSSQNKDSFLALTVFTRNRWTGLHRSRGGSSPGFNLASPYINFKILFGSPNIPSVRGSSEEFW